MEHRKKVAVFSPNIYEPMTHAIQEGISKAALELGVKVFFFVAFSDDFSNRVYEQYNHYDEGDIAAFELPDLDDFDGIIRVDLAYGPYTIKHLDDRLSKATIPIINVAGYDERYLNVVTNETESFINLVSHLIEKHGSRDIYHLAGLRERNFTQTRIDAYRKALESHGIAFDPDKVYYGTLWRDCGEAALDYFIGQSNKRGRKYPEAIICANDYSAMGLIAACKSRGIRVPGDIIVTGYDGIEEAYQGLPSITTSEQPFYESGYQSVYALHRIWDGEKIKDNIRIKNYLKPGNAISQMIGHIRFLATIRPLCSILIHLI